MFAFVRKASRWWKQKYHNGGHISDRYQPQSNSYEPAPLIIRFPDTDAEEAKYKEHDRQYKDRQIRANYFIAAFTAITAGVGIWQGIQTRDALQATNRQATASEESNMVARSSIQSNLSQNREILKSYADHTSALINSAAEQNQKAIQASIAENKSLMAANEKQNRDARQASIDASHIDQRAWLGVKDVVLTRPLNANSLTIDISVNLVNTGKTPALDVQLIGLRVGNVAGIDKDRGVVAPNNNQIFYSRASIPKPSIDGLLNKTTRIDVQGIIRYKDIFGADHQTDFCQFWPTDGPDPNHFWNCESGNWMN